MSQGCRILIIEDDTLVARELALRVAAMGYLVIGHVADAASALSSIDQAPPDLALVDIMLGDKADGIRVSQYLQERNIPSLYLTAYADDALFERARITSPQAYLIKPYNDRELQLAIELALQRDAEARRLRDRHAAEQAGKDQEITQLEALLSAIVEGSTDSIFAKDEDGHYILCNRGTEQLLGKSRGQILGHTDQDIFPLAEAARFRADDARLKQDAGARTYEEVVTGAAGARTFLTTKGPLRIDGKTRGVFGIARDITERKTAERRLQRLSGFYNALAQTGQAIAHADSADQLLQRCCEIVVRHGQVGGAWIGFLDEEGWLSVAAGHGLAQDYLASVRISIDGNRPEGPCQTGLCMRDDQPTVFNDFLAEPRARPWHEAAQAAGVRASAAVPIHRAGRVVGALTVYANEADFFDAALLELLHEMSTDIAFALDHLNHEAQRRRAESDLQVALDQLHVLSARLIDVQEAERRRLARDLHDDIGQNLTMLKIALHSLSADHPDHPDSRTAAELADRTLRSIRSLSYALRPPQLDDLGLASALRAHFETNCQQAGLHLVLRTAALPDKIPESVAIACFRIAQEALTNVVRHAAAKTVHLSLQVEDKHIQLRLLDDGRGFDIEEALAKAAKGTSLGLLSMRERAALAGGDLTWSSRPGQTEVTATLPLNKAAE